MKAVNLKNDEKSRRDFIKKCGLSSLPFLLPPMSTQISSSNTEMRKDENQTSVNFIFDGLWLSPKEYIQQLQEINQDKSIQAGFYGNGGATQALENKFAEITGKEKAIYLPSGTMANQLAIKLLNGNNTKVIVPENSHIFRDEADAAQAVHNKRLIPVWTKFPYFNAEDIAETIKYVNNNEVFRSGLGTICIEHPIRRADGVTMPIEIIKQISEYCKANNFKLHMDGARIHIASAYTNISIAEYASHVDTIYISLYKYLNTNGGAILCGDATIIDQVAHQIKIYGGTIYQNWANTSMALHFMEGIEGRWKKVVVAAEKLLEGLNKLDTINIRPTKNGSNIYQLTLDEKIDLKKLADFLRTEYKIWIGRADEKGVIKLTVNESLLRRPIQDTIKAWEKGLEKSKKN